VENSIVLVLVVEDDPLIRLLVEDTLSDGGFQAEIAPSAERAMTLLDAPAAPYRALLTDIDLGSGKPTGWDVARHARTQFPTLPVVYITGNSAADWASMGVPNSVLVMKPFAPAQLVTAVSQLLNAVPPPVDDAGPR